ncbi:MAG: Hpt domain-containing protein [Schwartzia sp.]|nr:Hpt domain-containing protein [Schwartzia sp. (in: firmicutes)]
MSALLNELRERGCDVDGALARFLNKEDFYAKCYKKFLDDPAFAGLDEALKKKDADTAFRHAHTLKGLMANMGLTPLHDLAVQIVEPLRAGLYSDELVEIYRQMMKEMDNYRRIATRSGL